MELYDTREEANRSQRIFALDILKRRAKKETNNASTNDPEVCHGAQPDERLLFPAYSARKASTGLRPAAVLAGSTPASKPITTARISA